MPQPKPKLKRARTIQNGTGIEDTPPKKIARRASTMTLSPQRGSSSLETWNAPDSSNNVGSKSIKDIIEDFTNLFQKPGRRKSRKAYRASTTLNIALVECMRELFMEAMRDGEIRESERQVLQMMTVVLSQVSKKVGQEYVSMVGEDVEHIDKSFPELADFLEDVGKGMKAQFLGLRADGSRRSRPEDHSFVMQSLRRLLDRMLEVQTDWQTTPEELIAICKDDDGTDFADCTDWLWVIGIIGWGGVACKALFSCFRMLVWLSKLGVTEWFDGLTSFFALVATGVYFIVGSGIVIGLLGWFDCLIWFGRLLPDKFMMKIRIWEMYEHGSWNRLPLVCSATWFFFVCFLYSGTKSWLDVIMAVLEIRVILCFASSLPILGQVTYPLCYVAENLMSWSRDHQYLGCLNAGTADHHVTGIPAIPNYLGKCIIELLCAPGMFCTTMSLLAFCAWNRRNGRNLLTASWQSVTVATTLAILIGLTISRTMSEYEHEYFQGKLWLVWNHTAFNVSLAWMLKVFLDFLISTGMCAAYDRVAKTTDRVVQPILMLRSMKLGSEIRQ